MGVVVGYGINDYYSLEQAFLEYYEEIFDAGITIVVSETGTGFIRYLIQQGYRCAIMTPTKERDYIKGPAIAVFIAVKNFNNGATLKSFCNDHNVPSRLFVVGNSMTQT